MNAIAIIQKKRDRGELTREEMSFFLRGYVGGSISDHQAAALVTSIFLNGLTDRELTDWTRAMIDTGTRLSFPELPQAKVDKHSTGGVGDKVSIPLAPAVAACGVAVPMISGRGLGHTGGTLDKLEAIPGFRVRLSEEELHRCLDRTNVAFGAQTDDLVPADKKLYALRDAIGMVESVPLIASSIMSKKLAEGIEGLVLDVKFGSGAFKPDVEEGAVLARKMIALGRGMEVDVVAYQTAMDRPLGRAVGHALEIDESIECLAGGGPHDLRELVLLFGGEMLRMARVAPTVAEGKRRIADALDSGRALRVFERVIVEQGGDPRILMKRELLPRARRGAVQGVGRRRARLRRRTRDRSRGERARRRTARQGRRDRSGGRPRAARGARRAREARTDARRGAPLGREGARGVRSAASEGPRDRRGGRAVSAGARADRALTLDRRREPGRRAVARMCPRPSSAAPCNFPSPR